MKNIKILVTGNKGYVGSHLTLILEMNGHQVTGFDFPPPATADLEAQLEYIKILDSIRVDQYDVVIHLGAIRDSLSKRPDIMFWNYQATVEIADRMTSRQRLIYFSSCMAIGPSSPYGWSKKASEQYIEATHQNHVILRPFNIYGGREHADKLSVPSLLANRQLQWVFTDVTRDYIHVQDVVRGVEHVLNHVEFEGTYELATGKSVSPGELADILGWHDATKVSRKILDVDIPAKVKSDPLMILPGFKPQRDIKQWCKSKRQ